MADNPPPPAPVQSSAPVGSSSVGTSSTPPMASSADRVGEEHIRALVEDKSGSYNGGFNGVHFTFPIPASLPKPIRDRMIELDAERDLKRPPVRFGAHFPRILTAAEYAALTSLEQGRYDLGIYPGTKKAKGKVTAFRNLMAAKCQEVWGISWSSKSCLARFEADQRQCILYTCQTMMADMMGWTPEKTRHQVEQGIVSKYRAAQDQLKLLANESASEPVVPSDQTEAPPSGTFEAQYKTEPMDIDPLLTSTQTQPQQVTSSEPAAPLSNTANLPSSPLPPASNSSPFPNLAEGMSAVHIKTEPGVEIIPPAITRETFDLVESPRKRQKVTPTSTPTRTPSRVSVGSSGPPPVPSLARSSSAEIKKVRVRFGDGLPSDIRVHGKLDRETMLYQLDDDVDPSLDYMCKLEKEQHKISKFTDKNFRRVVDKAIATKDILNIFRLHEDSEDESTIHEDREELQDSAGNTDPSLSDSTITNHGDSDKENEVSGPAGDTDTTPRAPRTMAAPGNAEDNEKTPTRATTVIGIGSAADAGSQSVPVAASPPKVVALPQVNVSNHQQDTRKYMGKNFPIIPAPSTDDLPSPSGRTARSTKIKLASRSSAAKKKVGPSDGPKPVAATPPATKQPRVTRKTAAAKLAAEGADGTTEPTGTGKKTSRTRKQATSFEPQASTDAKIANEKAAAIKAGRKKVQEEKKVASAETEEARRRLLAEM
ncbi:hypothetical protein BJ508DRAFT_308317 [Ascobolus immersus RN42]|uniref:Uncharacterized protein n=1 Tax=Ascobolus immersus RN42 TaxID=1160509 RepID=A0A3N4I0D4_ASCIM|nr:hypothetical protein BJ508DRAFT_308317 [Ascobolus immersus RN42]